MQTIIHIDNMLYIWMIHYSLVKGIYRKRFKGFNRTVDGLAFFCSFLLFIFILVLLIDKELFWEIIRSGMTFAPIVGMIVALLSVPFLFFSRKLTKKKIGVLRKVINLTRNIKHMYSVLYVSFYISLFIIMLIVGISSMPYHH